MPENLKTDGGWYAASKRDKRKIFDIPSPRALTCWAVWSQLIDYANYKQADRFSLSQVTLSKRVNIGRRLVHLCLDDLKVAGLLTYTAPKSAAVGNDSTRFVLKPSVPPWSPSDHPHGRSTSNVNRPLLNNGDNQRLSPVEETSGLGGNPPGADAPGDSPQPPKKKTARRDSWMPEGGPV